ncbi:MAG: hypothetical protein ACR2P4_00005, partial [Gammaproteobacteria bacterium]
MANAPTSFRDEAAVAARTAEVPDADWDGGMNLAGSCSEGIGIATDVSGLTGESQGWTLLDQDGDTRTPQVGQHVGGNGLGGVYPASGGVAGKGVEGIEIVTPDASGDGTGAVVGEATLASLA